MKEYTYSFDVFDTCLIRKCGRAENLFDLLSFEAFLGEVDENTRQLFVANRIAAQNSLWPREDVGLEDIYQAFGFSHPMLLDKGELVKKEMECERLVLLPVQKTLDKVRELHQKGFRVIFISDMYLSRAFILSLLKQFGFYEEGDAVYVSCEENASKATGELYQRIKQKEHLSYRRWVHYGDNRKSDYEVPRKLGIKAHRVCLEYSPYAEALEQSNHSLGFNYEGVVAGLSRAFRHSFPDNAYRDLILDLIAPFYCSLTYRIMEDAQKNGIQNLFFCARDAWQIFLIAQKMQYMFPKVRAEYLYISKKSLYDGDEWARLQYFKEIGLASNEGKNAIVDIRSSGHTLYCLNEQLSKNGFNSVRGYYFQLFNDRELSYAISDYYCELNSAYHYHSYNHRCLIGCWQLYESLFSMNIQKRTVDYEIADGKAIPVFGEEQGNREECFLEDKAVHSEYYRSLLSAYADAYVQLNLCRFSNAVFEEIAIPTLMSFFTRPEKCYLKPLEHFYVFHSERELYVPYVRKESLFRLIQTKGKDSMWRRGTVVDSLPRWVIRLLMTLKK